MAWILQGNPNRFDIDEYLSRYTFIYWSAPTNQKDFSIGDSVFIWRAGADAGIIAYGKVKELTLDEIFGYEKVQKIDIETLQK